MKCLPMFVLTCLVVFGTESTTRAVDPDSMMTMLDETRQASSDSETGDTGAFSWWFPREMVSMLASESNAISASDEEWLLKAASDYNIFLVGSRVKNFDGTRISRSAEEIRKSVKFVGLDNDIHRCLQDKEDSTKTKQIALRIESILHTLVPFVSDEVHVVVFPVTNSKGVRIADPKQHGIVSMIVEKHEFNWHLPLSGLTPPAVCPKCKEKFRAAFSYCPWDGTKLRHEVKKDKNKNTKPKDKQKPQLEATESKTDIDSPNDKTGT